MPEPDPLRTDPHHPNPTSITPPAPDTTHTHGSEATRTYREDEPGEPPPSESVPGYEILGELGRGGMGVVYRARDVKLGREVALKMVLGSRAGNRTELVRFMGEAAAVAAVRHPNVVQVYEYGESHGRPYMALEYLPGGSLAGRFAAGGRLAPARAVELVTGIARGVAAAHAAGIIHRDLKPHNILLTDADEPKVTDFGLAKRGGAEELTRTGAVMGTPAYMAPEQAGGGAKFVGPAADVWALGVVLHECLAGSRPFSAASTAELLARIMTGEPAALPPVPRDLALICRKCLEKNPADRYPTAKELAEDLARFARDEPISVRPAGLLERAAKWARRNPTRAGLYAAVAVLVPLAAFAGVVFYLWRDADDLRRQAVTARDRLDDKQKETEKAKREVEDANTRLNAANKNLETLNKDLDAARHALGMSDYARTIDQVVKAYQARNFARVRELLAEAKASGHGGWEYDYLHRLSRPDGLTIQTPDASIRVVCFDPAGKRFASASGVRVVKEKPLSPVVRVWDARTGAAVSSFSPPADFNTGIASLAFTRAGELVGLGGNGTVFTWNADTGAELKRHTIPVAAGANSLQLTADARLVGVGTADAFVLYDVATGNQTAKVERAGADPEVRQWAPSADGTRVASLEIGSTARVFEVATGKQLGTFSVFPSSSRSLSVALSADGKSVAVSGRTVGRPGTNDGPETIKVWDVERRQVTGNVTGAGGNHLWLGPDGRRVLGVPRTQLNPDDPAVVWEPDDLNGVSRVVRRFLVAGPPLAAAFSPDGTRVVCSHPDGILRVWGVHANPEMGKWQRRVAGIPVALSPDTRIVWGWNNRPSLLAAYDTLTGERLGKPVSAGSDCRWVLGPADSRAVELHVPENPGRARLWDISTQTIVATLTPKGLPDGATPPILAACFDPTGTRLATLETNAVRVWDAATGAELIGWPIQTGETQAPGRFSGAVPTADVEFSPDGGLLAVGTPDGRVRFFDPETSELHREFNVGEGLSGLAISPDGQTLCTRTGKTAALWDIPTGRRKVELRGHGTAVTAACFSPDDRRVVTGTEGGRSDNLVLDHGVHVWDAATGRELLRLGQGEFNGAVRSLRFSPDGRKLVAVGGRVVTFDSTPLNRAFLPAEATRPSQPQP